MVLSIEKYGSEKLRVPARKVAVTPELAVLAEDMLETMYKAKGVGLAAEQVGRDEALCVIDVPLSCEDDEETKTFKPNSNILEAEEVYFYAKFETASFTIEREHGEPGQTFVYHIQGPGIDMHVSITCDENGYGSKVITEVPAGSYTVTEVQDWSWRYPQAASQTKNHLGKNQKDPVVFSFDQPLDKPQWLTGWSDLLKNIFTEGVVTIS
jgi:hypothetical protein